MVDSISPDDLQQLRQTSELIRRELSKTIVGQTEVIDQLLISLFAGGHSLLVGVPGLAKTLLVRSLADVIGLKFSRIQFTPDLMPADITGTEVIQEDRTTGEREFRFIEGPIFANVILADEINRTPPKTQAALLEAMQEKQVTVSGVRYPLPAPFFVLATQNPIEQEGTYPLPEAQLDRFMMEIRVDYPDEEDEFQIVQRKNTMSSTTVTQVVSEDVLKHQQKIVHAVPMAEHDMRYAIALVRATRVRQAQAAETLAPYLAWGAGPRASEWLVMAARAHAAIHGRNLATAENVQAVLAPVLRHRLVTNFNAEADGITPDDLVRRLLESVPEPGQGTSSTRFKRYISV